LTVDRYTGSIESHRLINRPESGCAMLIEQLEKAAIGLAMIVPAILLLRWFLTRKAGSPDEWAEDQIRELERRLDLGQIDEETFKRRVQEMRDS